MEINTERLILREFRADDWRTVHEYQNDAQYLKYYKWAERSEADVKLFIKQLINWQQERPRVNFQFAIILNDNFQLIGNCGIRKRVADALQADIGYELNPLYWKQGYAYEATTAIINFGFRELQLHRIWAHCITKNSNSIRLLERLGMRREGKLRENEWMQERWWDSYIYSILAHEWPPLPAKNRPKGTITPTVARTRKRP